MNFHEFARAELLRLMGGALTADQLLDDVLTDLDNGEISAKRAAHLLGLHKTGCGLVSVYDLLWEAA